MEIPIEKQLEADKINNIIKEKCTDQISLVEFNRLLHFIIEDEGKDGFDDDHKQDVYNYLNDHMSFFTNDIQNGFSVIWARENANHLMLNEVKDAPAYAYRASRESDPQQALLDLEVYCILNKKDQFYKNYFTRLLEYEFPETSASVTEMADNYSRIYKEQIAKGKSEIFAHYYANLTAEHDYHNSLSYAEATEYENALLQGFTKEYAQEYAEEIADLVTRNYRSYDDFLCSEWMQYERGKISDKCEHLK